MRDSQQASRSNLSFLLFLLTFQRVKLSQHLKNQYLTIGYTNKLAVCADPTANAKMQFRMHNI